MVNEFVSSGVKNSKERTLPPLTNKQTKNNGNPPPCSPLLWRGAGGEVFRCTVKKPQIRLFNPFKNILLYINILFEFEITTMKKYGHYISASEVVRITLYPNK